MTAEIATTSPDTATWDAVGMLLEGLASRHGASFLSSFVSSRPASQPQTRTTHTVA
ncbi:MAG: hypothetical protein JWO88_2015 [Frankiales bacterium]|nr:hypothetical protein [Frankiales bacterium]